ncbi:hypothetical protein GQ457_07G017640 [Hibiscus cannabinus]
MAESGKEQIETAREGKETTCWGCGSRLHLPTNGAVFRCGWCGAITNHKANKPETRCLGWRRLRDRCFVSILSTFILFVICAGIWAALPVIFSVCYTSGIVHSVITTILAVTTVSTFGLAAFRCAGAPPMVVWGSYTVVGKGDLKNYTFCRYCCKPKSPRAHHCRSCGMCILDMDHHCPFVNRELCWRSESSAFHRFHNFSYFEFNLRFGDLCVCEFPYMAAIGIQNPPPLGIIHHPSVDPGDKGSNSGFDKISHGAFSEGTGSGLPVFCERFGGDQFDRSSMAATVLHLRRPNLSQPVEFSGRRSSGHRERLPEPCTVLRLSMFHLEILAHPAKFAKEAQEVERVFLFLSSTEKINSATH